MTGSGSPSNYPYRRILQRCGRGVVYVAAWKLAHRTVLRYSATRCRLVCWIFAPQRTCKPALQTSSNAAICCGRQGWWSDADGVAGHCGCQFRRCLMCPSRLPKCHRLRDGSSITEEDPSQTTTRSTRPHLHQTGINRYQYHMVLNLCARYRF